MHNKVWGTCNCLNSIKWMQVCIDLGAAPGAWTELLAAVTDGDVIAVDPAELSESCAALPNVHHVKANSTRPETGLLLAPSL